jgi:hypothetical protein
MQKCIFLDSDKSGGFALYLADLNLYENKINNKFVNDGLVRKRHIV